MKCGVCVTPGQFEIITAEKPETAPEGWVLLDNCAVGICGTDYHIFEGKHPFLNYPRVIGHELSGTVAEDAHGWSKGDLVVINPYVACGTCRACRRGKPNCCYNIEVFGVHRDGGLCDRLAVPAGNLYSAEGLTKVEAAMVEFLAIGAHAVRRSEIAADDRVLVTGAGPIGIGTALFAQLQGAEVHLLDKSRTRLDFVSSKLNVANCHLVGEGLLTGDLAEGFDTVFDATGSVAAIQAGFALVAHGGSYVLVSVVKDDITFADPEFHKREMRLIGSRNALKVDFESVIEALRTRKIDGSKLCSEQLSLEDLAIRLPELASNRDTLIKAVVTL
ncbi:zinc-binding alcohol dehydrogenase family protein [Pelagibius litoralis]|uniref:Zinc-binding alcohol dehydrogenase family protein n=2 Tax=Pelagibius litoralis TaxID=374515 RepID=A0A967F070_9PROT|nr:zinc-binding alcohol dehydrogenase family protein [Pelagibius litoralis]